MECESPVYTLDEALAAVGFGKFQGFILVYAGIGWFSEAMEIMILSFVGPAVELQWELSASQESLLSSVVFAGILVGAYSWGLVSDNYGRRRAFVGITVITSGTGLISAFAPNYESLVILRGLVGIGLGGSHVFLSWFLEFVPTSHRGKWMVVLSTFWTLGAIFEAALAWIVMPMLSWRWLLVLSAVPSLSLLLFYGMAPESPRYLCQRGRTTEAVQIMEKMASVNQTKLPPGILQFQETASFNEECSCSDQMPLLVSPTKEKVPQFKAVFSTCRMLFSPNIIQTTLLLWLLFFTNVFLYYGIILLTSQLSISQTRCGSRFLHLVNLQDNNLYKNQLIASLAGRVSTLSLFILVLSSAERFCNDSPFFGLESYSDCNYSSGSIGDCLFVITGARLSTLNSLTVLQLPGLLLSGLMVDKFGRKHSMATMFILAGLCLLPLVTPQPAILTTGLLFGSRLFSIGTFTIACIYAPELYPTAVRSTGAGAASAMGRIGGMICPLVAVALVSECHLKEAVILFEVVIGVAVFCILLFPFDTTRCHLDDTNTSQPSLLS